MTTSTSISSLHSNSSKIRNVCVLAHVDHGKTTLTDSLLASNAIISEKLAGKVRFLDKSEEEQVRGITMEAHAISLVYKNYLVNLIDAPGHVDFSADVSSAVRLCDGALIVVDAVEGVCVQTHAVMRIAWEERLKMCLVINKIDRLITELQLSPEEAQMQLQHIVQQVNAVISGFIRGNVESLSSMTTTTANEDDALATEKAELEHLFYPENGDTLFTSGTDSFAFSILDFVPIVAKLLNVESHETSILEDIRKSLWGVELVWDGKLRKMVPSTNTSSTSSSSTIGPLFSHFVLKNIWSLYEVMRSNPPKPKRLEKMLQAIDLSTQLPLDSLPFKDVKQLTRLIMGTWLPCSRGLFELIIRRVPDPVLAQANKVQVLWPLSGSSNSSSSDKSRKGIQDCDPTAPVVIYIAKMISVPKSCFSNVSFTSSSSINDNHDSTTNNNNEEQFVGIGRVFSGTIDSSLPLYIVNPTLQQNQHQQMDQQHSNIDNLSLNNNNHTTTTTTIIPLLAMGGDFKPLPRVPAGNVLAILGLGTKILKTGTLVQIQGVQSLAKMPTQSAPILRVSIEPLNPRDWDKLTAGLRILNRADPALEVRVLPSGEHVLAAIGELHLERCVKDLRERYAKVEFKISEPLALFRETLISLHNNTTTTTSIDLTSPSLMTSTMISMKLADKGVIVNVRAIPLSILMNDDLTSNTKENIEDHDINKTKIPKGFILTSIMNQCALLITEQLQPPSLKELLISGFTHSIRAGPLCEEPLSYVAFLVDDARIITTTSSNDNNHHGADTDSVITTTTSTIPDDGQIVSAFSDACRRAFKIYMDDVLPFGVRLMEPFFRCNLHCLADLAGDHLGKLYSVVSKRRGRIISETVVDGTSLFQIEVLIPVVEAFGLADELRKKTSGAASSPQLIFSHWEVLDVDPYKKAMTEEQLELQGETVDWDRVHNIAYQYVIQVRKRKGLSTGEKIIAAPEKQRNLSRKR
jgi:ribosome assembly protein 1